jgi:alpha-tubulin suppressor-like RCC1 family protein
LWGVFSFGDNRHGDLGIGSKENKNSPQKIKFENDEKINRIFSSYCCSGCFFYSGLNLVF